MLNYLGVLSQRLLASAALWAAALLLIAAAPSAHSATVEAEASSGGSLGDCDVISGSGLDVFLLVHPVQCHFGSFPVQVFRLDLIFDAPPNVADFINCDGSPFFAVCGARTPSPGVTDFFLSTPSPSVAPGIPANQSIDLVLGGFAQGQEIEVVANAPEPPGFPLALVGLLAIISSWRSKRAQSRGTQATPAI